MIASRMLSQRYSKPSEVSAATGSLSTLQHYPDCEGTYPWLKRRGCDKIRNDSVVTYRGLRFWQCSNSDVSTRRQYLDQAWKQLSYCWTIAELMTCEFEELWLGGKSLQSHNYYPLFRTNVLVLFQSVLRKKLQFTSRMLHLLVILFIGRPFMKIVMIVAFWISFSRRPSNQSLKKML